MKLAYNCYVFFKDFYDHSILNLLAYLYSLAGEAVEILALALFDGPKPLVVLDLLTSHFFLLRNFDALYRRSMVGVNKVLLS
jgi:hypothetical protein